jgi:hypothetical protein
MHGMHYELRDGSEVLRRGSWRPTTGESRLFLFSKSMRYYADQYASLEPTTGNAHARARGTTPKSRDVHRSSGIKANAGWKDHHKGMVALRNPRNVWDWPPEPQVNMPNVIGADGEPVAHYAPWPMALAQRIISIATPERGVCSVCALPWLRVVERVRSDGRDGIKSGSFGASKEIRGEGATGIRHQEETRWNHVDWKPMCSCAAPSRPAIVFDPFSGTGTTPLAAESLGRRGIGSDLSLDYLRLSKARTAEPAPAPKPQQFALWDE